MIMMMIFKEFLILMHFDGGSSVEKRYGVG